MINLEKNEILEILNLALSKGGDYAELFYEDYYGMNIRFDNGKFEELTTTSREGASIRVLVGEDTYFAHTNSPSKDNLLNLAKELSDAVGKVEGERKLEVKDLKELPPRGISPFEKDFKDVSVDEKMNVVKKVVEKIKDYDKRIVQITVLYGEGTRKTLVATSDGEIAKDIRNYPILYALVVASDGKQIFSGFHGEGGNAGFEFFTDEVIEKVASISAKQAIHQLEAEDAPAGEFTVVISSDAGGTMIHEACGHGLEADIVLKMGSVYAGRVGQKVASEKVTVIDDGTLKGKRGSFEYDDEGVPTERTVLIENGILKGYMHTKRTAKKMGVKPTGNARRETYIDIPIVRMRNTFVAPGNDDPEEIIKSVKYGILVKRMGGGQVDPASGNFTFGVTEAYLIEDGKITKPLRGASLVGNGPKVLEIIDMVGNDLGFAVGTCGKNGQGAPVSDAMPTIRIPKIIVGGIVKGGEGK